MPRLRLPAVRSSHALLLALQPVNALLQGAAKFHNSTGGWLLPTVLDRQPVMPPAECAGEIDTG